MSLGAALLFLVTSCASVNVRPPEPPVHEEPAAEAERREELGPADAPRGGPTGADDGDAAADAPADHPSVGTSLRPPRLSDPLDVHVDPDDGRAVVSMDPDRDYVIVMPDEPVRRPLVLSGGRNVVLIGGEVSIPWQGRGASINDRTGLKIRDATGTVHVEGLLLRGDDITEGIQIDAPQAIVQLQNVGVFGIHARDQVGFSDNHPDIIQTYGNVRELHVDGLTGTTDYQGLFFKNDFGRDPHGPVTLRNVNVVGEPTARYLIWFGTERGFGDVHMEDVWVDVPPERDDTLRRAVWPSPTGDYPERAVITRLDDGTEYARWHRSMDPKVVGGVHEGRPPGGDFVRPERIGIGYERPGD